MTNREAKTALKTETKAAVEAQGLVFSEEAWNRACAKATRWMKKAYGESAWESYTNDGCSIMHYYMESIEKSKPEDLTANREMQRANR